MVNRGSCCIYKIETVIPLLFFVLALSGCGTGFQHRWPQPSDFRPHRYHIDAVPFYPQKAKQCGPASLAMSLQWGGVDADPDMLSGKVFTPSRQGSLQSAMVAASRRYGRVAYLLAEPEDLLVEIAAGHPVIVLQNLGLSWFPVWHYAVAIGYDLDKKIILLHSGMISNKQESLGVFDRTWARSHYWGLLVLPPTRLPAVVDRQKYITAVSGLEQTAQWQSAVVAYKTALSRWPDDRHARMGLGNSFYALGDLAAAETAFREVTRQHPLEASAFNNLAQVLWERGERKMALQAARKAVQLGGPLVHIYRETLLEIEQGMGLR